MTSKRKLYGKPTKQNFSAWWKSMPLAWQEGFVLAMNGGAFRADFTDAKTGKVDAVLFFVHPDTADQVQQFLEGK